MNANTTALQRSAYMFILGLGLGSVMQVLVLVVQNAVDYRDLGVATSGATLFRSVGGTIGTAILGSIFASRLKTQLADLLPAGASSELGKLAHAPPTELGRLPPAIHHAYVHAYTNSLGTIFLVAAGVAGVAFLLSWLLEQRELRDNVVAGNGIGESFAVPKDTASLAEAARALTVLIGRDRRRALVEQWVRRAEVDVSATGAWLLARLDETPAGDINELSTRFDVPAEGAAGALAELSARGFIVESAPGELGPSERELTTAGRAAVQKLVAEREAALARMCDGWDAEGHEELAQLLTRLARELVLDPEPAAKAAVS